MTAPLWEALVQSHVIIHLLLQYPTGSAHLGSPTFVVDGNGQQRGGRAGPDETWVLPYLKKQMYKQADTHTHTDAHR